MAERYSADDIEVLLGLRRRRWSLHPHRPRSPLRPQLRRDHPHHAHRLAESFSVEIRRQGRTWTQSYRRSLPLAPLADVGPASRSGVTLRYLPDPTI